MRDNARLREVQEKSDEGHADLPTGPDVSKAHDSRFGGQLVGGRDHGVGFAGLRGRDRVEDGLTRMACREFCTRVQYLDDYKILDCEGVVWVWCVDGRW